MSGNGITYKKDNASGRYMYFYKYRTNVFCKIPDMPSLTKNVDGKSIVDTDITLNFEVEFFNNLNFILELDYREGDATNEKEVKFNIKLSNNIKVGDFDLTANFFADSLDWTRVKKETVNIHTTTDFSFDAEKGKLEFTMPDFNNTDITLQDSIEKIGKDIEEIIKKEMAELNKKIKSLGFKGEE
jgi:hypothetical protein